jgi:cytochrome c oxidase subunit 2
LTTKLVIRQSRFVRSQRTIISGNAETTVTADDAYIISSIYNPNDDIVVGFAKNLMQSYRELLSEADITLITGYLKTLSQDAR